MVCAKMTDKFTVTCAQCASFSSLANTGLLSAGYGIKDRVCTCFFDMFFSSSIERPATKFDSRNLGKTRWESAICYSP